jgi:hypothetical protein
MLRRVMKTRAKSNGDGNVKRTLHCIEANSHVFIAQEVFHRFHLQTLLGLLVTIVPFFLQPTRPAGSPATRRLSDDLCWRNRKDFGGYDLGSCLPP